MLKPKSNTVDQVLVYTRVTADSLSDIADATQIPFIGTIATLALSIIPLIQVCL
jgi:hypothetical protein